MTRKERTKERSKTKNVTKPTHLNMLHVERKDTKTRRFVLKGGDCQLDLESTGHDGARVKPRFHPPSAVVREVVVRAPQPSERVPSSEHTWVRFGS